MGPWSPTSRCPRTWSRGSRCLVDSAGVRRSASQPFSSLDWRSTLISTGKVSVENCCGMRCHAASGHRRRRQHASSWSTLSTTARRSSTSSTASLRCPPNYDVSTRRSATSRLRSDLDHEHRHSVRAGPYLSAGLSLAWPSLRPRRKPLATVVPESRPMDQMVTHRAGRDLPVTPLPKFAPRTSRPTTIRSGLRVARSLPHRYNSNAPSERMISFTMRLTVVTANETASRSHAGLAFDRQHTTAATVAPTTRTTLQTPRATRTPEHEPVGARTEPQVSSSRSM